MVRFLGLAGLCLLFSSIGFGQAVRYDYFASTTSGSCMAGQECPLLVLPGTAVTLCSTANATTFQSCVGSPATTYTTTNAGTPCPLTAQLTPQTGGACTSTSDAQGNYGWWAMPGLYSYYLRVPITAGGGTYGPFQLNIGASSGCPSGATCDANYATLPLACTAAGSGTLYITRAWTGLTTQTFGCSIVFLATGRIQPAFGQTVTFTVQAAGLSTICDITAGGSCSILGAPTYYPQWWGGVCSGSSTADDTALNAAFSSVSAGSVIFVDHCGISNSLLITQGLTLLCSGWSVSSANIIVSSGMSTSADVIHVQAPNSGIRGLQIKNCGIVPVSGNPAHYGINLDATSGIIANFEISGNDIGQFSAQAIATTFPSGLDGIFNGKIEDSILVNGFYCNLCGDDISVIHNTITGVGPGVNVTLVPGANTLVVERNSMSMCNGAVYVHQANNGARIRYNDIQTVAGCAAETNNALIDIDCQSMAFCVGSEIYGNTAITDSASSTAYFVRTNWTANTKIDHNYWFLNGMQIGIQVTSHAVGTIIRDYQALTSLATAFSNANATTQCDVYFYPSGPYYFGPCPTASSATYVDNSGNMVVLAGSATSGYKLLPGAPAANGILWQYSNGNASGGDNSSWSETSSNYMTGGSIPWGCNSCTLFYAPSHRRYGIGISNGASVDETAGLYTLNANVTSYQAFNWQPIESGANNALVIALTDASGNNITLAAGLEIKFKAAHTLQAGANTLVLNATSKAIKSSFNPGGNIGTATGVGAVLDMFYDGTQWQLIGQ